MARSNREIPHYYLQTRIDMSRAMRWLEAENQKRPIKERLLLTVLLLKAVARALGDVPELNGYWLDDHHQPQEAIHPPRDRRAPGGAVSRGPESLPAGG
jgi:pyruvate dehydrogenase E2 component (dihydrolipoamide acetyltransferase)